MVIQQKSSNKFWYDESGQPCPYSRTTKAERKRERYSATLLKKAMRLNKELGSFKEEIQKLSKEAYEATMAELKVSKKTKGNFTWYNFNRTIKTEVSISEPIQFDDLTIEAAKAKFDEFLNKNIEASNEFVKELVLDAFSTSNGKLDSKKVMSITRHKDRVNKPLFTEAVDLVNKAIRRPKSREYFRIWVKDENGKYQNIDLNLSSIEIKTQ